jgi:ATP-dependent DNA ligase
MQTSRDMTDFTSFGGSIAVDGTYVFPTLYYRDSQGKIRIWEIRIELVEHAEDGAQDVVIPIKSEYLKNTDLPDGAVARYWSRSGRQDGKITEHKRSIATPANVGKKNARNTLKSALVKARALYLKETDKGRVANIEDIANSDAEPDADAKTSKVDNKAKSATKDSRNERQIVKRRIYPMLARNYADETIHYPIYLQPKLDGMRAIIYLEKSRNDVDTASKKESGIGEVHEKIIIYSRLLKDILGFDKLRNEILPVLHDKYDVEHDESLYLDGEFYEHGKRLQDITGIVRNIKKNNAHDSAVKFHVFDAFYPSQLSMPYSERLKLVSSVFQTLLKHGVETLVEVPTISAPDEKTGDAVYKRWIESGYEGAMYKTPSAPYLGSKTGTSMALRSHDVIKRKNAFSDEFEVVGYTEGARGKDVGAIIWICKTPSGHEFNVTPKDISYDERSALFKQAQKSFDSMFKGRMMTVEYQDLSRDGVPLRAKAVAFRDYE